MFKQTINTSSKTKFIAIFALSFCFFAIESLAQSEQEKVRTDLPVENSAVEDLDLSRGHVDLNSKSSTNKTVSKPATKTSVAAKKPVELSLVENKQLKKEEPASTLSFNLFLYIVDKFKAD